MSARITDGAGTDLAAEAMYFEDQTRAYATFDLAGLPTGSYDVVLELGSGESVTVAQSLEVVPSSGGHYMVDVDAPANVRRLAHYQFTVTWGNDGLNDLPAPLLRVGHTAPFGLEFGSDDLGTRYTFLGVSEKGPAGILRPGESYSITFFTYSDLSPGTWTAFIDRLGKDADEPFDWDALRPSLIPAGMTDADFEPIFQQLLAQIGSTWGDYLAMLSRNAALVAGQAERPDLDALLRVEVELARAALGNAIVGQLLSVELGADLAGTQLFATNQDSGEKFLATVYHDGTFIVNDLTPGSYTLSVRPGVIPYVFPGTYDLLDGQNIWNVQLILDTFSDLTVYVTDPLGLPVANTTVRLYQNDRLVDLVNSDSAGTADFTGVPVGTYVLIAEADGTITRGSHVEPDQHGRWFADLSPVSGPVLGGPFCQRTQALQAERSWLEQYWIA